jgi:hypothetical protein
MLRSGWSSQSEGPPVEDDGLDDPREEELVFPEELELLEAECGFVEAEESCDCLAFEASNPGGGPLPPLRSSC